MENNNHLTTAPIPDLIKMIAIPSSMGFLFNTLFNVVDTYFAGIVSTDALAALSLSFPVFFIIIALGSGVSTAATALIANSLGAGDMKSARFYSVQSISFGFFVSLILTWLGLAFSPFLFRTLGASDSYLAMSLSYSNVIFYGSVFFLLSFVLSGILSSQGNTKTYRNLLVIGFFLNIIFDPWFIRGGYGLPAMGLAGVAWATVVIQFLTTVYLLIKVGRTDIFCKECKDMLIPRWRYYRDIARQGFPASLNMLTVAIGIFVITYFISRYGKAGVAAYGIATRIDQMAVLPIVGLNIAALTLVGQNNGAKLFGRVKETIRLCLLYGFYVTIMGAALVLALAPQLMGLFSQDREVVRIGVEYLRISAFVYFAYTTLYVATSALQGLKKPLYAIWIGLYRQIAAPLLIFWVLAVVLDWQLKGVWWGVFIINTTAAIITLVYMRATLRKLD
ncbi:MATE family efflux transporter [Candidatus Falkowbacteria bacterium]|nr:MATE family efflux transporter [Candidatus Falkowbacteria bacterium]